MSITKTNKSTSFAQDMRDLDNIANAYHNCSDGFRDVWKKKWYEMVAVISKRIEARKTPIKN